MSITGLKKINNLWVRFTMVLVLIVILCYFLINVLNKKPIIIGFVAQLTGNQAELGVQERNGVLLAVENINSSGGIAGHKVKLIIRDDFGTTDEFHVVDRELVNAGVVAIIGHATSAQTLAGLKVTNPAKVLMIGSTVSTPELSGLKDYFFRVYPSFNDSAQAFAQYIYKKDDIKRLAIIYDNDNAAYSKSYSETVANKIKSLGGIVTGEVSFSSVTQPDFSPLLLKLRESKAEGLLIIASDVDTAVIAQRARLLGWQIPLFTSSWAPTQNLIDNGGQAVEGLKFEQAYALTSESTTLFDFQDHYKARFGNTSSFGAALAYDATMALSLGLKKTEGKPGGLMQALLENPNFSGLMGSFSFDTFGDVERPYYLSTIRNGEFVTLEKLTSTNSGGD